MSRPIPQSRFGKKYEDNYDRIFGYLEIPPDALQKAAKKNEADSRDMDREEQKEFKDEPANDG